MAVYSLGKDICVKLNGEGVLGSNSFSFDSSYPFPKVEILGKGIATQNYKGRNECEGSISALILDVETTTLYNIFLYEPKIANGQLGSKTVNFEFTDGYIKRYNVNGSISSLPSESIDFVVYGNVENTQTDLPTFPEDPQTYKNRSINLQGIDSFISEHIQSFNYSISTNWKPSYIIGKHFPNNVSRVEGYTISLDVDIIVNTKEKETVEEELLRVSEEPLNLGIFLVDCEDETTIDYLMPNARLEYEGLSANVNGFLEGTLKFKTYINDLIDLII